MNESKPSLRQQMDQMIADHGLGRPLTLLAGLVGWNAKWESRDRVQRAAEASVLLAKAAAIILRLEEEEAKEGSR